MDRGLPPDIDELLQRGYGYAMALTREPAAAEDLVQDACLGLVRRGAEFEMRYLFAAIRNRYIDLFRRARLVALEPLDEARELSGGPDLEAVFATRDQLERAFAVLREEEREAVYLNVNEGYTAAEIGELTARPRGTVLSLIHRARKKLRDHLEAGEREVAS